MTTTHRVIEYEPVRLPGEASRRSFGVFAPGPLPPDGDLERIEVEAKSALQLVQRFAAALAQHNAVKLLSARPAPVRATPALPQLRLPPPREVDPR